METPNMQSPFESSIVALDVIINMVYVRELKIISSEQIRKYGDGALINPSSIDEIRDEVKKLVSRCLSLISRKYRKELNKYLNDDGIIYYIYTNLFSLIKSDISNIISSLPSK